MRATHKVTLSVNGEKAAEVAAMITKLVAGHPEATIDVDNYDITIEWEQVIES